MPWVGAGSLCCRVWGHVPNTRTGGTGSGAAAQPATGHRHAAISRGSSVATLGAPMAPRGSGRLGRSDLPSVKRGSGSFRKKDFNRLLMTFRSCHRCGGKKRLLRGTTPDTSGRESPSQGSPRPPTPRETPTSTTMAMRMAGQLSPPCIWQGKPCTTTAPWRDATGQTCPQAATHTAATSH